MGPTFDIYEDTAGEYRWRLTATNNDIIADSGEGYATRSNAVAAVDRIRQTAPEADRIDFGHAHYVVYADQANQYRWRLVAGNGRIIADSGQGYASKDGAKRAVARMQEYASDEDRFELYEDAAENYRWRVKAPNGRIIADSGQGYASKDNLTVARERVSELAPDAEQLQREHFDIYEDAAGQYRWRLIAGNGQIIADGGQGYTRKDGARQAVDRIKTAVEDPPTLAAPLGIAVMDEGTQRFEPIITSDQPLPAAATRTDLATSEADQTRLEVRVLQGGADDPADNTHLTTATLTRLSRRPKGELTFQVQYLVDSDGTLLVTVEDTETGESAETTTSVEL